MTSSTNIVNQKMINLIIQQEHWFFTILNSVIFMFLSLSHVCLISISRYPQLLPASCSHISIAKRNKLESFYLQTLHLIILQNTTFPISSHIIFFRIHIDQEQITSMKVQVHEILQKYLNFHEIST